VTLIISVNFLRFGYTLKGFHQSGVTGKSLHRSGFGLLLEVDWSSLFKSLCEKIRIKIACRSPTKIPAERSFEMDKKLYMVTILVEGVQSKGARDPRAGPDDDDQDGEGKDDDEYDDLDDIQDTM
jgi:hypothetical protein